MKKRKMIARFVLCNVFIFILSGAWLISAIDDGVMICDGLAERLIKNIEEGKWDTFHAYNDDVLTMNPNDLERLQFALADYRQAVQCAAWMHDEEIMSNLVQMKQKIAERKQVESALYEISSDSTCPLNNKNTRGKRTTRILTATVEEAFIQEEKQNLAASTDERAYALAILSASQRHSLWTQVNTLQSKLSAFEKDPALLSEKVDEEKESIRLAEDMVLHALERWEKVPLAALPVALQEHYARRPQEIPAYVWMQRMEEQEACIIL